MKGSKYMRKYAWINVRHKKKRTRLSIVAICLSTAIIFTSLTLFKNIYHFSKTQEIEGFENYHYAIHASLNVSLTPRYQSSVDGNTGYFGSYHNKNFNLRCMEESNAVLPFELIDGTWPKESHEIVVSDKWRLRVGDQIELVYGTLSYDKDFDMLYRIPSNMELTNLENQKRQTFIVSGVYEDNESFSLQHQGVDFCYTDLPMIDDVVYYILDSQVQVDNSFEQLINLMGVDSQGTVSNSDFISLQVIQIYLRDTTVLLMILVVIICLSLIMSFISVHNVIIVSDKERKKEIGLLKSVGASFHDVRKLLHIELTLLGFIGALLGIIVGIIISYFVLKQFCQVVYIEFSKEMVMDYLVMLISLLVGISLMYFSGMKAYKKYIYSSPISDLHDVAYNYHRYVNFNDKYQRSFEYKMFTIYNQRMKLQTKNILYSFILLFATTVLFTGIVLSNQVHQNQYEVKEYDFELTNLNGNQCQCPNPALSYLLYEKFENKEIECQKIDSHRFLMSTYPGASSAVGGGASAGFFSLIDTYNPDTYQHYIKNARNFSIRNASVFLREKEIEVVADFCNVYYTPAVLDEVQFEKLKPYIKEGSLDNFGNWDVVAILHDGYYGTEFCENLKVGDSIFYGASQWGIGTELIVRAIVVLPRYEPNFDIYQFSKDSYYSYYNKERVMAFSLEGLLKGNDLFLFKPNDMGTEINEHIYFDLHNEQMAADLQGKIDQVLLDTNSLESYQYTNYALLHETSRMTTFLIKTLLYPLLLMLFVVSIMNIHHVFAGNIYLKVSDISMMKSIGMTNKQSKKLFTYEYEEGYLNAAFWISVIFVPLALIESKLPIDSSFSFGANVVGTLILSLLVLDIMIIVPLVFIALRKVRRIEPLNQNHQNE